MIELEINDAQVRAAFVSLGAALTDMHQPMDEIGQTMVLSTKTRMQAGVSPDGTPFAPRSAVTLARYAAQGKKYGPKPLWLTGTTRQNIAHAATSDSVSWGSNAIQAAVMHFGAEQGEFGAAIGRTKPSEKRPKSQDYFTPIPWGRIPARPFVGLSEQDGTDITDIVTEWLARSATP